jgi:hypothetical protein
MAGDAVKGALRLTWESDNEAEIAFAEKTFKEYLRKGWVAISETSGEKKQIFTFNPNLEKIILAPIYVGG